jgi:NAD(P)-dependent dehydrogenase (short-subunit alcohol dehydrogenase family)
VPHDSKAVVISKPCQSVAQRLHRGLQVQSTSPKGGPGELTSSVIQKRYGTSEEVARLAVFLASDEASYCSGGIHMIDGRYTAG